MNNEPFRQYLQSELIIRSKKNPSYSLRAFAMSLGVPASSLSLIIKGSRKLTEKMKIKLGVALNLSLDEISKLSTNSAGEQTQEYRQLTLASFEILSEWYYYAILELTKMRDFKPNSQWIASTLKLPIAAVNKAIENLMSLGLLIKLDDDTWVENPNAEFMSHITPGLTSEGAKKHQRELRNLAEKAITEVPIERRDHTSLTVAINKKDIAAAKEKIKLFRREMDSFFSKANELDEVYHLTLSLFPSTHHKRSGS